MANWPRAVLFDFDGVIVNSEPLHFQAFQEVLAKEKIPITEDDYYQNLIGFDDLGAFRRLYELRGLTLTPKVSLALMADKATIMRGLIHRKKLAALPGVEETVRQLWRRCPLAIVSGAIRDEIELMLEGISLRDCFQFIIAAEDVTVGKPDPSGYLMAKRRISDQLIKQDKATARLKPEECLIIEDAPKVIKRAGKEGFRTMGVCTTYGPEQLAGADWIVDSLKPVDLRRQCPELKVEL